MGCVEVQKVKWTEEELEELRRYDKEVEKSELTEEELNESDRIDEEIRFTDPDHLKKERLRENSKRHYEKNRDAILKQGREYRKENKEKLKEYKKAYYQQHKAEYRERRKRFLEKNRDKMAEYRARKTEQERDAAVSDLETIIDRLADYEKTGLEPEDITRVFNEDSVLKLTSQILQITPDRLRELAKADRDGRCAILSDPLKPMVNKPNDTDVYCPNCGKTLSGGWELSDADDTRKLCQCPKCGQSIDDTKCEVEIADE